MRWLCVIATVVSSLSAGTVMAMNTEESLKNADRAFAAHAAKHGPRAAFLEYMAEDGVVLRATGTPLEGRTAYAQATADDPDTATLAWAPEHAVVSGDGTLGYTWGYYLFTAPGKDGVKQETRGKYLSVWRRQGDGTWKFIADIGNIDPSGKSPDPKN